MRAHHNPEGHNRSARPPRRPAPPRSATLSGQSPTRRRFLAGGAGVIAGTVAAGLWSPSTAGAHEVDEVEEEELHGLPRYRNRQDWGAEENLRLPADGSPPSALGFHPVQLITVHHTASWSPHGDDGAVELIRAIYREHLAQEFGDIGYHLLIDPGGTVYEGHYSGGTSFPIYQTFPGQTVAGPRAINGAHLYSYNAGNVGVALMGDCTSGDAVTWQAWESLVAVVAHLAAHAGLDPLGTTYYVNPISGTTRTLPTVACHRDVASTLCPGDAMVGWMEDLRQEAATMMSAVPAGGWFES